MSTPELSAWERAYLRFQTPAQERRKFLGRLRRAGLDSWSRDSSTLELFCGRGNSLQLLEELGFRRLVGVDLSLALLRQYRGGGALCAADCRTLPIASGTIDVAIVQGGLHHLPRLPGDLDQVLCEVRRVLSASGMFVMVEPWRTPFLDFVLWCSRRRSLRRLSASLEAFATMVVLEQPVYSVWLASEALIRGRLDEHFMPVRVEEARGSLLYVGRARGQRPMATESERTGSSR